MKLSDLEEQFTLVSQSTASYDVKLKELNDSKQQVITSTDQMLSDLSQEESALEVTYGLNYRNTDAYRTLRTQIDDVTKSKSNLITKYDDLIPKITQENYLEQQTAPILADLTSKYALMQASADTALPNIQARFNDAFNSGNIQHATVIISEFAQQYGISFSDAEKTIENFKAAQATVPQTIEEQLVGKAQNDMQAFKDCMAGKTATLASDATGHMQTMASDITDLINHGLVGEAQDAMQSYVNCNTNKVGTMTLKLTDDMNTLTKNYKDQLTQMTTLADSLTGQQKDAVLKQIDDMTSQYETKMQQLKDWQAQILGQMETQTDDSFANMTDTALGHAKRMSDQLVALSIWPDMLDLMGEQTQEGLEAIEKRFAEMSGKVQGAMPSASVSTALNTVAGFAQGTTGRPITVNITGPLVMIQGNADKATVDLAAKQVLDKLKSAIVEPSSSNAGYNQKRIRSGATFT
jgi:hypothetical protein